MKTPEKIKKALSCSVYKECMMDECPYYGAWPYDEAGGCFMRRGRDTIAYIQQLENQLREATKKMEQLEAEQQNLICDFMDYINDSIPNPAPFCAYRETCALVDACGWCKPGERGCNGFVPRVRDGHE